MEILATSVPLTVKYKHATYDNIAYAVMRYIERPAKNTRWLLSDLIAVMLMQLVIDGSKSSAVAEVFPALRKVEKIEILMVALPEGLPMEFRYRVNGGESLKSTAHELYRCSEDIASMRRTASQRA